MSLFQKQNGAISVFLSLVLIPVLLFSFLTVDAARIYTAKVTIADSSEMSMNAALAQYDEELFDKYGLFGMKETPEAMSGNLEKFFVDTLNSNGIEGASNYEEILGLLEESFSAMSVSNTEVYRTEVEKQQILEYMKYRAPVCLTEELLEKIGLLKDSKKVFDAIDKQTYFAEAMEECQDAFKEALKELDDLNSAIESFPSQQDFDDELGRTQIDLLGDMAKSLLILEAFDSYKDAPEGKTLEEMVTSFTSNANRINLNSPLSRTSYEGYLYSLYYENGIKKYKESNESEYNAWMSDSANAVAVDSYSRVKEEKTTKYITKLETIAAERVNGHYNNLNGYYNTAKAAIDSARRAESELDNVREKLNMAYTEFRKWDQATMDLGEELAGEMPDEVNYYRPFFGGGSQDPMEDLGKLQAKVSNDYEYFTEVKRVLEGEKLFDKRIAIDSPRSQMGTYEDKAEIALRNISDEYKSFDYVTDDIREESFKLHYQHVEMATSVYMERIKDDAFYKKLQEYCEEKNDSESEGKAEEQNENLDEGANDADGITEVVGLLSYDWTSSSQPLPSVLLGYAEFSHEASDSLTATENNNNIKNKGKRRSLIRKMREAIEEATGFLDGVSGIIERNAENLFIAEYAMQMFSYYTCDKRMIVKSNGFDIEEIPDDKNLSLSGYKLSDNKAYKSEVEYILWGNSSAAKNVGSTIGVLFGIRLLFNSLYAFTNHRVNAEATTAAELIVGSLPFLVPIVKVAIQFGIALIETVKDVKYLKDGYAVAVIKKERDRNFETSLMGIWGHADARRGRLTLNYGEYLRIILNVQILFGDEKKLSRIGDCIQVNSEGDISKDYTMIEIEANVGVPTAFMGRVANLLSLSWDHGDSYTVNYRSILGY